MDIDRILTDLGIPWETSKTIPFTTVIPYLGFSWDLEAKMVALSDTKKEKYRNCIMEWQNRSTHTLTQVQSLYGKLLHSCLVVTEGRAYLTSLETMLSTSRNSPFVPHSPPRDVPKDLRWWYHILEQPNLSQVTSGPIILWHRNHHC